MISRKFRPLPSLVLDSTVCPEKNYTLLKWLLNKKYIILGDKFYVYGKLINPTFI